MLQIIVLGLQNKTLTILIIMIEIFKLLYNFYQKSQYLHMYKTTCNQQILLAGKEDLHRHRHLEVETRHHRLEIVKKATAQIARANAHINDDKEDWI